MKILYLVLCINAFILLDARADSGYVKQYKVLNNQKTIGDEGYLIVPVLHEVSSSNVFQGRQYPWRRTIPLVPQSDSIGGQAPNNQVSLLSLIALALNLGNTLFAAPAPQVQRDPASSVAAGVTTGILNYISSQGGQTQTLNDPVAPNRLGINVPQNDVAAAMVADNAGVSKVRQYMWGSFPFQKGDWEWEKEIIKGKKKKSRRVSPQRMTNLNIFVNRGPNSQQIFNRMKNSQSLKKSQKPRLLKTFDIPKRVIVLVPDHHMHHMHHTHYRPRPSYPTYPSYKPVYHPSHHQPSYQPVYHPSHHQPSYQPSYKPAKKPSYHQSYQPSHHYPQPSYTHKPQYDDDEEYTVPVILEDDDEGDYDRPVLYELSTELVDTPLDYVAQPVPYDDRPSQISMDEDDDDDDDDDDDNDEQNDEVEDDGAPGEDDEEYKRSQESSKERIKGEELKQINNRLKEEKS